MVQRGRLRLEECCHQKTEFRANPSNILPSHIFAPFSSVPTRMTTLSPLSSSPPSPLTPSPSLLFVRPNQPPSNYTLPPHPPTPVIHAHIHSHSCLLLSAVHAHTQHIQTRSSNNIKKERERETRPSFPSSLPTFLLSFLS